MIVGILIYILSFILGAIGSVLSALMPNWTIWPPALLDGLTYFFNKLMDFNIFFPVDTALTILHTLILFFTGYFSMKILFKLFNFGRGSDSL